MEENQENKEEKYWYMFCRDEVGTAMTPASLTWPDTIDAIHTLRERGSLHHLPRWQEAVTLGIVPGRAEYLSLLRDVSIGLVVRDLEDNCDEDEITLIHLVRILDETDKSLSCLYEKIEDYHIALHPAELTGYERNAKSLVDLLAKNTFHPLNHLAKNIERLHESRVNLAKSVREYAEKVVPNMAALCGPLVAARLIDKAGSVRHLAHMPGSSLQVLGAGPSLFTHLTGGTNPPKHGIIFQYKGVHHAKRKVRGRVSRVLACKLVIAAKIDHFRGIRDDEFIAKAREKICRAG